MGVEESQKSGCSQSGCDLSGSQEPGSADQVPSASMKPLSDQERDPSSLGQDTHSSFQKGRSWSFPEVSAALLAPCPGGRCRLRVGVTPARRWAAPLLPQLQGSGPACPSRSCPRLRCPFPPPRPDAASARAPSLSGPGRGGGAGGRAGRHRGTTCSAEAPGTGTAWVVLSSPRQQGRARRGSAPPARLRRERGAPRGEGSGAAPAPVPAGREPASGSSAGRRGPRMSA